MRSSLLTGLTTRGTSFLTAGAATVLAGLLLGSHALLSVGVTLIVLPLLARFAAGRSRYRLSCVRTITPSRVPAGYTATVKLRLENASRLPTGLILAEDSIRNYGLGSPPRYVIDGIERGGSRELTYPLRSDLRGRYEIGPLEIRIIDAFGIVELGRSFSSRSTLIVTPRVVELPRTAASSSWAGDGDGLTRTTAAAGEDDVIPRAYRDGDELRRVHWRSTARYGELMVRREEQRWRNRALVFLDTRRGGHAGSGVSSSFEFAVSAAASVGVHLTKEGLDGQLITDAGAYASGGIFEDVLLDTLSVVKVSGNRDISRGLTALRAGSGGMIVAVLGSMTADDARRLAACRRDQGQAIALLLAVSTWSGHAAGSRAPTADGAVKWNMTGDGDLVTHDETAAAAAVLRGAGWRVTSIDAATPLVEAWRRLPRATGRLGSAGWASASATAASGTVAGSTVAGGTVAGGTVAGSTVAGSTVAGGTGTDGSGR
jgi:uncharacterized protein (DUF58 family)